MSTKFYYKSVVIKNHRTFDFFECPQFCRINLIGGLNSTGKSTLLESLYSVLDRHGPYIAPRPLLARNVPITLDAVINSVFYQRNIGTPAEIEAQTRDGRVEIQIIHEPQQNPVSAQGIGIPIRQTFNKESTKNLDGLTVKVILNGENKAISHVTEASEGVNVRSSFQLAEKLPIATIIQRASENMSNEATERFGNVIQNKFKSRLLDIARITNPEIRNLLLLQSNNYTYLNAEIENETYVPLSLLGGGTTTLVEIALSIISCKDGAVFLDEFDNAIHYSKLKIVWEQIALLSNEFNCQIFAATHSKECIEAAIEGANAVNRGNDLQYIRIDNVKGSKKCAIYKNDDLKNALDEDWEVR